MSATAEENAGTEGAGEESGVAYKASETAKRDVAEILATDAEDESLRKYKESLLGAAAHGDLGDVSDPRRLVITEFRVVLEPEEKHDDLGAYEVCSLYQRYFHMFYLYFCTVYDLSTEAGVAKLKNEGIALKEGCKYKFRISFRVQHEIVAGIKFVNKVRKAVFSDSDSLMIGSFLPASTAHVFEFPRYGYNEAPSGMLYRGKYSAKNSFIDSDGVKHLELEYPVDIRKSW